MIAYESEAADTIDPMAGSYYVESLTRELEEGAREYLARIDDLGGAVAAIERGFMQREIQNAAFNYQREIETKQRIIVGVNQFTSTETEPVDLLKVKPEVEEKQKQRVARVRAERDGAAAQEAVARVAAGGRGRVEPDAADHRSRPPQRHAGRDCRRDAARIRRTPGQP